MHIIWPNKYISGEAKGTRGMKKKAEGEFH